jgi:hypothetical protein
MWTEKQQAFVNNLPEFQTLYWGKGAFYFRGNEVGHLIQAYLIFWLGSP